MGPTSKTPSKGASLVRCLGDAFWTFPFLGTLWCAPLVLCLVYMRFYSERMWGIAGAMNLDVSTLRTAWDLGFWVLIGVNGAALTVALFSSGKLLELLVGQACCSGRARCLCNGMLLMMLGLVYLCTLLAVPVLLAVEVVAALLCMMVMQTSVTCDNLTTVQLASYMTQVSTLISHRVPAVPRFSVETTAVPRLCTAMDQSIRGSIFVVALGFFAVLCQVLFSTAFFSRLWAARMEQKSLSLYTKARAATSTVRTRGGGSAASLLNAASQFSDRSLATPKNSTTSDAAASDKHHAAASVVTSDDDEESGSVWQESKFGPIEEEGTGEVLPYRAEKKGTFFSRP